MTWLDEGIAWRSGAWSLERRDDELADISYDGMTVLRSIRAVVRDSNWDTAASVIDDVASDASTLTLRTHTDDTPFDVVTTVTASDDALVITAAFEARDALLTNRTGLVVLHPAGVAGAELETEHPDGTVSTGAFPEEISPHQPVFDIARLAWRSGGLHADLRFEGDVFEMEDQRNWTDASFKTYSRPLALPFPYPVAASERIVQTLRLRVARVDGTSDAATESGIVLRRGEAFPHFGVAAATAADPAPTFALPADVVVVELDLDTPTWPAALARAGVSGTPLDVRCIIPPGRHDLLAPAARALVGLPIARVTVFDDAGAARHVSPSDAVDALRAALGAAGVDVPVTGGSRSHFTELNRERHRLPADLDALLVTCTPLFHALGTAQLIESVAMQRRVATQSVRFAAGIPVHIGPVSLRPRYNDVATEPLPAPTRTDVAEGYGAEFTGAVDPRQAMPELAAWVIASAAALAVNGVASLTYFEEWGPRGLLDGDGAPTPAAAAFTALAALRGGSRLTGESPDGLVWAIGAISDTGACSILVANLDRIRRTVPVTTPAGEVTVEVDAFTYRRIDVETPRVDVTADTNTRIEETR